MSIHNSNGADLQVGASPIPHDLVIFLRDYLAQTGGIHLVSIEADVEPASITGKWFGDDWQAAAAWALAQNVRRNVYFTFNKVMPGLNQKPTKADIVGIRGFHVDIDPPKDGGTFDKTAVLSDLHTRFAPSYIIDSGRGVQAIWLTTLATDKDVTEQANQGLRTAFRGDHTWNCDRLLRLVGLTNHGSIKKRQAGYVPSLASLLVPFSGVVTTAQDILSRFPADELVTSNTPQHSSGPIADWCGPEDDAELIAIMRAENPSIKGAFSATTRDMWDGNEAALALRFPSDSGDTFNRSEADAGLVAKLAWYTGNDAARIDRLFRQSALFRAEKWDRDTYRLQTISKVIARTTTVYSNPKYRHSSKSVTVDDLVEQYAYFPASARGVVPVHTDDANAGMGFDNFKRDMMKYCTSDDHGKPVNPAHVWQYRRDRLTVDGLMMRPDRPVPTFMEGGKSFINTYYPPAHTDNGGTIDVSLRFFEHLLPNHAERTWFLKWLAHKFLQPSIPGVGVIMVAHGVHGTGRGSLTNQLFPALFGSRYVSKVELSDLTGRDGQSQFNDFAADSLIVTVDEASDDGTSPRYSQRRKAYDALKSLVEPAARQIRVKRKFGSNGAAWTFASYVICTNHRDAIAIPADDRRFAILQNGDRMPQALRFEFHQWVSDPANIAAFAQHLRALDIGDYSPYVDPPLTDAKLDMADAALSDVDRAVAEILEEMPSNVFTAAQVVALIADAAPSHDWRLPEEWQGVCRKVVQNVAHRVGVRDGKNWSIAHGNKKKVAVYAKTQQAAAYWKERDGLLTEVKRNDAVVFERMFPPPGLPGTTL
ncbi:hypothetical protein J5289_16255 [Rhizobium sp. B230/85]|uniref:phage NrS-1 polymerase family protein n=1 Tax=unclassified Rhizobium TaxID=2613769 RepID=UPI001AD9FBA6|nr:MULTISPECIES: DUF5906 domain-containing protein [unclassified Rhizobium]MBO9131723.1 hypothetical protein [Rhizobium sp. B209b/85]QXZ95709.1 hypothetical protein J5289_16255 [Rhizobium sp. B230/85]